jgi:hypothetical protein
MTCTAEYGASVVGSVGEVASTLPAGTTEACAVGAAAIGVTMVALAAPAAQEPLLHEPLAQVLHLLHVLQELQVLVVLYVLEWKSNDSIARRRARIGNIGRDSYAPLQAEQPPHEVEAAAQLAQVFGAQLEQALVPHDEQAHRFGAMTGRGWQ